MRNALVPALLFIGIAFSQPIVRLDVDERAGIARINEPVLMGVPLPESLYTDTSVFSLKDVEGTVVPCEFRAATRWFREKRSIRWLHLDFQASLAADEKKQLFLCNEPASHSVTGSKLMVTDQGTFYQVNTGQIRFNVKKHNFNLIDQAWVDESGNEIYDDAHKVIASHDKGFSLLTSGGIRYFAANDTSTIVTIERIGPMAAVLKAEGRLKNAAGSALFYFAARIYVYNNSPVARVVFSWENRNSNVSQYVPMYGLNLELPLVLSGLPSYGFGGQTLRNGSLASGDTACLLVSKIDKFRFLGVLNDSGNPKMMASYPDFGSAWLSDGNKGMGVLEQYFWQTYPSSVEARGDGTLNLGMFSHRFTGGSTAFPPRFADHYNMYSGMGRTHDIRLVFFNDSTGSRIRSMLAGANSRVLAAAPPAWYCRGTRAFGNLLEKDNSSLYTAANWSLVRGFENSFSAGAMKCLGNTNAMTGGKDAYDYLGWGDNPHQGESAGALMWNGNYYDLPHLFFIHFIRTGNYSFLDYAIAHSQHVADLHLVHFEGSDHNDGGSRYCPPMNHIGADALAADVQGHSSHHKTQSQWEKYWLLGDDRALDMAERGLKWIEGLGTSMANSYNLVGPPAYPRRIGHVFNTLNTAYQQTLSNVELGLIGGNLNTAKISLGTDGLTGGWGNGLGSEGFVDAYYITGRADLPDFIRQCLDSSGGGENSNSAYTAAFLYRQFSVPLYLSKASQWLISFGNGVSFTHHEKDYSENGRSIPKALYFYAIPDSAANRNVDAVETAHMSPVRRLGARPNPFNPTVTFEIPEDHCDAFRIYRPDGRLAGDLTPRLKENANRVTWNASGMPAGLYVAEYVSGCRKYSVKAVLVR